MKHIISFSGGLGSAVSAILAWENNLDFEMIFADTLIEDEDLYRFNQDIENLIGKSIIVLTDGRDPWEVYEDKRWIGNSRTAHCSQELKTKQVKEYLQNKYKKQGIYINICLNLGMGTSELDRIERAEEQWRPLPVKSLLREYRIFPSNYPDIIKKYNIDIPRLYTYGFPHNNCGGFCCRAGLKQFATLLEVFPDRFMWHENRMEKAMNKIGSTAKPFLKRVINGEVEYLTLKRFRELYEAGDIEISPYDYGGCGCFVDE